MDAAASLRRDVSLIQLSEHTHVLRSIGWNGNPVSCWKMGVQMNLLELQSSVLVHTVLIPVTEEIVVCDM